jgi:O-antigen ligase
MPQSFWDRMDSITNAEEDPSGSRQARIRLLEQGVQAFAENPLTGLGAGQFQNYNGPGMVERWRVTHNVWLQVACDLGIFGLLTFAFLFVRVYSASFTVLRLLKRSRKHTQQGPALNDEEQRIVDINAKSMVAAAVGWTVCSMFASVAFNWTFYYVLALAVAGREIVASQRTVEPSPSPSPAGVPPDLVRVHA